MDSYYASKSHCPIAARPVFSQTGRSPVSDPTCYFGGFAVAEHNSPYPCQDPPLYRSAFQPTRFSPAVPVSQYCGTPLTDRMPCSHGVVGLPATGQLVGEPLDCNACTCRTQSPAAEPSPERFVLVRQNEPSNVVRTFFTKAMKKSLEARFAKSHYVTKRDREQLAYELQVTEKQIRVWFQNRRVKERKQLGQFQSQPAGDPVPAQNQTYAGESVAQAPLKALYTMCQDIKPDDVGSVRDEQKGQFWDNKLN